MTRRSKAIHTIIVPIALLVMVAMAVVVAFILFSAKKQDEIARNNSIKSVSGALDRHLTHLERIAKDFAWWNEAVENLVMSVDLEWADQGIGFYAFENYGYETSFVHRWAEPDDLQLDERRAHGSGGVLCPAIWSRDVWWKARGLLPKTSRSRRAGF